MKPSITHRHGCESPTDYAGSFQMATRLWRVKYFAEWGIAVVAVFAIAPLLIVLALLVKLTSTGPVLYVCERLGKHGKVFRLYKFRSMYVESKQILADDGKVVTLDNDPRVTCVGRVLRFGFDELPQLLNVIKGDMCLIGPRPDVVWERDRYDSRQVNRLNVLPGITGLTQVMSGRELTNAQNYELDVRYVERSSIWTDWLIAVLTIPYSFGAKSVGKRIFKGYLVGMCEIATATGSPTPTENPSPRQMT